MVKCEKQPALVCPIDAIGTSACPVVAFSGFQESPGPPLSINALSIVLPHCDGHQNSQQSRCILHHCFVDCHPGGSRGNTKRVVARW